jgi:hypothetical protein
MFALAVTFALDTYHIRPRPGTCDHHHRASRSRESASLCQTVLAALNKCLAQSNKSRPPSNATKRRNAMNRAVHRCEGELALGMPH